jgi:recombinational DNA repair protein RecT
MSLSDNLYIIVFDIRDLPELDTYKGCSAQMSNVTLDLAIERNLGLSHPFAFLMSFK